MTGPPDRALNGPGGCRLAALHQVGNYRRYTGRDASSFGKAARDPERTSRFSDLGLHKNLCSDEHARSRDASATHIVHLLVYQRNRSLLVRWQ